MHTLDTLLDGMSSHWWIGFAEMDLSRNELLKLNGEGDLLA
jgi:hypothetical protein